MLERDLNAIVEREVLLYDRRQKMGGDQAIVTAMWDKIRVAEGEMLRLEGEMWARFVREGGVVEGGKGKEVLCGTEEEPKEQRGDASRKRRNTSNPPTVRKRGKRASSTEASWLEEKRLQMAESTLSCWI